MVLKRIGVLSAAKIGGVVNAAIGVVIGLCFSAIFSLLPMMAPRQEDVPFFFAPMLGIGAIVFMPIMYGVMGFIGGAIGAVAYNLFAGVVGGLELQFETPPPVTVSR
jgi:hypothetical protein